MPDIPFRHAGHRDSVASSINTTSSSVAAQHSSSTSSSSLFSRITTNRDDSQEDTKGSLGLNLLYAPPNPLIDFVFVHGLGGGARRTWSKTSSIKDYWPQEWLPEDPAFKIVRIHSFGYNSDWAKGKDNCLNIHHFGKSLLAGMNTSPYVNSSNTSIVLIGHSMGGLVIKKSYMLARQDMMYDKLAKRVKAMHFLATPHKGSDSAKLLSNVLETAYSSRAYVADLKRNSGSIQSINDEFRNYSTDLDLWSFYETQKLTIGGIFSTLIVDPDSATMGYPDEKQIPMNADHRSICKFYSMADPNYIVVRNVLASNVNSISKTMLRGRESLWHAQVNDLKHYLSVSDNQEDDFVISDDARIPGTCKWLSEKTKYREWRDSKSCAPNVLWINGKPATGKSVLAGSVIAELQAIGQDCSYFYFKHGDRSKSRLGTCLRSIAFQMARINSQVRQKLLELQKDDVQFDKDNERIIWRKLFQSGILQAKFPIHYWVIDALDECANYIAFVELMLAKLEDSLPLKILIVSRETPELLRSFMTLNTQQFHCQGIAVMDTLPDIRLMVETKAKSLVVSDDEQRRTLVGKILDRSQGSFLWTILVLKELSDAYSQEEINQVLNDVPLGMESLYKRTLDQMSQASRGKNLAMAIISWTACAARPLTIKELDGALRFDIKEKPLATLEDTIAALCGQLVLVDKFSKVHMVHETAREFLLNASYKNEYTIKRMDAHTRIAIACLTYLTGDEMKVPRVVRRGGAIIPGKRIDFALYACSAFSYHLSEANPLANDLLILVARFLQSTVLSWIDAVIRMQGLYPLIRASKNLRSYLELCSIQRSPLGRDLHVIRGWTTDLIRITAKFGDALLTSPTAIYSLILPFCPSESMAYKTAGTGRRLQVVGISNTEWDERLSCIDFRQSQTSTVSYGDDFFAVGVATGTVIIYHAVTSQEYRVVEHGEAVRFVNFKPKSDLMVSCGIKTIRIWDIRNGTAIYSFAAPQRPIHVVFDNSLLIVATHKNFLSTWDLENDGAQLLDKPWNDSDDPLSKPLTRPPSAISISVAHKMMAIAYSGKPVMLWDLEEDAFYGNCGKRLSNGQTSTHVVSALALNPNSNIELLAVSYLDGELVILDPFNDHEIYGFRADCHTLTASPDGRLLAGAAGHGTIQIYEFETLRLLYRVKSSNLYIKQLAFSKDGLHFADVRGSHCNVWEPAALLRDSIGEDSSENTSTSIFEAAAPDTRSKITVMALHPKEDILFCGKEDGSVSVYDVKTGSQLGLLYSHKSLVRHIAWSSHNNYIMSVDASNWIIAWQLKKTPQQGWITDETLLQSRLDSSSSIAQILLDDTTQKFILSTREADHFWTINGAQNAVRAAKIPGIRKWIQSSLPQWMFCIDNTTIRIHAWNDWSEIACCPLAIDTMGLELKNVISYSFGQQWRILLDFSELNRSSNTSTLHLLDTPSLDNQNIPQGTSITALPTPHLSTLSNYVAHIINLNPTGKLLFLDIHSWVCSANLEDPGSTTLSYSRHFFVPYDWFSGMRDVLCGATSRDVLFAKNGEVAIVKGGLGFAESVDVDLKGGSDNMGRLSARMF